MRRSFLSISLTVTSIVSLSLMVIGWRSSVIRNREKKDRQMAAHLIETGRADEAAAVAGTLAKKAADSQLRSHWQETEITALVESGDSARLVTLYRNDPSTILAMEDASVLTARSLFFNCHDEKSAVALIATWKNKRQHPEWWFCLQVDSLLAKKKRKEAITLLKQRHFPGTADTGRLLRLAVLCDLTHATGIRSAWEYVQAAYRIAPHDPDVRSYRAQILERLGRYGEARVEYVAARLAKPQSVYHCDQLAEFYQHQGSTAMAIQTWTSGS